MLAIWNSSDNYLGDQNQKVGETITQITTADLPRQDKSHDRIIPDFSRHIPDRLSSFNSPTHPPIYPCFQIFPRKVAIWRQRPLEYTTCKMFQLLFYCNMACTHAHTRTHKHQRQRGAYGHIHSSSGPRGVRWHRKLILNTLQRYWPSCRNIGNPTSIDTP